MANGGGAGQFAGSFAQAFQQTMSQMSERKAREDLAKQQAKLIEMQLKSGQMKLDASTTLSDIMTGNSVQEFEPTAPIETPTGETRSVGFTNPGEKPMGLVEMMSGESPMALQGQQAALQSGAISGGDFLDFKTAQDQLASRPDFSKMFVTDNAGNPMLIPSGITIGPDGRPSQTFSINDEYNTKQDEKFSEFSFTQLVSDVTEVADIEGVLSATLSESGFPFAEQATKGKLVAGKVAGALGFDDIEGENKEDAAKRERARKLYGLILNRRLNKLMETDENLSITQIQQQMEISPSVDKPGPANILLLADFLQEELMSADIEGTEMSAADRKASLDFIRKARSGGFDKDAEPVVDVPAILKASREELDAMDIENMPQEQLEALKRRLKELQ